MKQKKKIDDIYREGLKNAETTPPADSWEFISNRLPKEEKEKVLPLWIKLAGVAAILALLVTIFNFGLFDNPVSHPIVNQEENIEQDSTPALENLPEAESRIGNTEINSQKDNKNKEDLSKAIVSKNTSSKSSITQENTPEDHFASEAMAEKKISSESKILASENSGSAVTAVIENNKKTIAYRDEFKNRQAEHTPSVVVTDVADASEMQKETTLLKKEISREILKEEPDFSEAEPAARENESFLKRLRISTTAGAVYFNMGNSNTVDAQLAQNTGGSDVSMTYGVNLAYEVSEKVKIRSGVSKVNFNYSTRQVDYAAASNSKSVRTDPAGMGITLAAKGDLKQEFGFIEIPLEVELALIDNKIGLSLIGGASTLLLEENNLSMSTPFSTTDFGEAQNLNELSFSANLGLGVHYKLSPKIRLNLEPIFKYHLNTFDQGNSHYFGIYSGLSYQF